MARRTVIQSRTHYLVPVGHEELAVATITSGRFSIGSAPDNDHVLEMPGVSGHHCIIETIDGRRWLEDLNSTNGTSLNARQITRSKLMLQDCISIVGYEFIVADSPVRHRKANSARRPATRRWTPFAVAASILGCGLLALFMHLRAHTSHSPPPAAADPPSSSPCDQLDDYRTRLGANSAADLEALTGELDAALGAPHGDCHDILLALRDEASKRANELFVAALIWKATEAMDQGEDPAPAVLEHPVPHRLAPLRESIAAQQAEVFRTHRVDQRRLAYERRKRQVRSQALKDWGLAYVDYSARLEELESNAVGLEVLIAEARSKLASIEVPEHNSEDHSQVDSIEQHLRSRRVVDLQRQFKTERDSARLDGQQQLRECFDAYVGMLRQWKARAFDIGLESKITAELVRVATEGAGGFTPEVGGVGLAFSKDKQGYISGLRSSVVTWREHVDVQAWKLRGYVLPPSTGPCRFSVTSSSHAQLIVDGAREICSPGLGLSDTTEVTVTVKAGYMVPIVVEIYPDANAGRSCRLQWRPEGGLAAYDVPLERLFPARPGDDLNDSNGVDAPIGEWSAISEAAWDRLVETGYLDKHTQDEINTLKDFLGPWLRDQYRGARQADSAQTKVEVGSDSFDPIVTQSRRWHKTRFSVEETLYVAGKTHVLTMEQRAIHDAAFPVLHLQVALDGKTVLSREFDPRLHQQVATEGRRRLCPDDMPTPRNSAFILYGHALSGLRKADLRIDAKPYQTSATKSQEDVNPSDCVPREIFDVLGLDISLTRTRTFDDWVRFVVQHIRARAKSTEAP
ncbi:MAG: hypothetical protein ACI8W8_003063 [Rhodothermales bacterium]|jgi:hypothetical protein